MVRFFIISMSAATLAAGTPATAQTQPAAAAPKAITRAQLTARLDSGFAQIDANKDGSLSADELAAAQKKELGQAQAAIRAQAQAAFTQLDTNKDGKLSLDEFAASVHVNARQTAAELVQNMDKNKDGKVSLDEFKAPKLDAFNKADANKDGTVTPAEVQALQRR